MLRTIQIAIILFAIGFNLPAAQPGADAKIEPGLIKALINSDDGTAPFFVVFADRTPLSAAARIRDWAARGRFVVDPPGDSQPQPDRGAGVPAIA